MAPVTEWPIATDEDLARVGTLLYIGSGASHRIRLVTSPGYARVVADNIATVDVRNVSVKVMAAAHYRVLTPAQAHGIACTMAHVDKAWLAETTALIEATTAALSSVVPPFEDVCVGDSFLWHGEWLKVTAKDTCVWTPRCAFADADQWQDERLARKGLTGYRRASPSAEPVVVPALVQHPGYASRRPDGSVRSEAEVEAATAAENDSYAKQQAAHNEQIKRDFYRPHRFSTNGFGSAACAMRAKR